MVVCAGAEASPMGLLQHSTQLKEMANPASLIANSMLGFMRVQPLR
jgi:hypothetical protein